jgi:hypothetical protein
LSRISHVHTNLVEHLVTLVKNEGLHVAQGQFLVTDQGVQTTGSGHHNVGVGFLVGQDFDVLLDRSTTVEDCSFNVGQVLRETGVLVLDLISELTGVAHDQDLALARNGLQLVKGGENEDRGFTETRLGLAKNIDVQNGSRNANLLDCWKAEPMLDWVRRKKKQKKKVRLAMSVHPMTTSHRCVGCHLPPLIRSPSQYVTFKSHALCGYPIIFCRQHEVRLARRQT